MADQPVPFDELDRLIGDRDAVADIPDAVITTTLFVAGREPEPERPAVAEVRPTFVSDQDTRLFRVDLGTARTAVGVHAFAPGVDGKRLSKRRRLLREDDHREALTGYLPDHLARRLRPADLPDQLRTKIKLDPLATPDDTKWATTVFAPEDRTTFSDTAFPWCTTGRVETSNGGWASGAMVGPRHLLTCSHAIGWIANPDPYVAGWIKFMPSYFDTSTPFGTAWGTHIYWEEQVEGPTIEGTEVANDYVVVVLDRPIGELTGWMGARTYDDSWDGGTYWSHIGYPQDISGGSRPTFQGNFSMNGDNDQPATNQAIYHQADVIPGQSGGPMFGWWRDEPWPRVVADQSWENRSTNGASGGSRMVDMIIRARSEHP